MTLRPNNRYYYPAHFDSFCLSIGYPRLPSRLWITRYGGLPPASERYFILQSWDTASKGGPKNDFSVCTTWFVTRDKRWYLLDVWWSGLTTPLSRRRCRQSRLYNARRILVEDMGSGMALVQELLGKVPGIVAVKSDRDKESRITAISSKFESGLVFLPKSALWLADFEAELFAFPGAKYDDQCDSVSQALWEPNVRFPMRISNEALAAASWPGATHREPLRCIGGF